MVDIQYLFGKTGNIYCVLLPNGVQCIQRGEKVDYIAIKEVAENFKVSVKTVRRWINQGLPNLKIGNVLRFKMDEVEKWIGEKGRR